MQKVYYVKSDDLFKINQHLQNGAIIVNISPLINQKGETWAFIVLESKKAII